MTYESESIHKNKRVVVEDFQNIFDYTVEFNCNVWIQILNVDSVLNEIEVNYCEWRWNVREKSLSSDSQEGKMLC